jgi:hypothetical protein
MGKKMWSIVDGGIISDCSMHGANIVLKSSIHYTFDHINPLYI